MIFIYTHWIDLNLKPCSGGVDPGKLCYVINACQNDSEVEANYHAREAYSY